MTDLSPASVRLPGASRPRVALLIDGDNLSSARAGALLVLAAKEGDVLIRRVYGGPGAMTGWEKTTGFRRIDAGAGKNAADLLLCVEAMDLMLGDKADVLVIASSDRDFAHLATHLREAGRRVVGIGEAKAPSHFLHSCSAHHVLKDKAEPATPLQRNPPDALSKALIAVISANEAGGWLPIQRLGALARQQIGKTLTELGRASWRKVLEEYPAIFECEPKGPAARVRLR